jgi:two-component system sensor histidine kinase MprB
LSGAPQRLARAVNNLIDNAVAYSPPGAPVEIELRSAPGSIGANAETAGSAGAEPALPAVPERVAELTVRDHGPGIAADDLPHAFDRFYRGADARGRPGSGLGLAIVRQVAEQHRGSVCAERAGGGGTLMRLRLPGAEAAEQVERAEPEEAARA